jgi:hypothetical protein
VPVTIILAVIALVLAAASCRMVVYAQTRAADAMHLHLLPPR